MVNVGDYSYISYIHTERDYTGKSFGVPNKTKSVRIRGVQKVITYVVISTTIAISVAYFVYSAYSKPGVKKLNESTSPVTIEERSPSTAPMPNTAYSLKTKYQIDTVDDGKALGYTGQQKIAVDSLGNVYVSYRRKYKGNYEIFVTKIAKPGSEKQLVSKNNSPISIIGDGATQRVPSITVSQTDVISVTWYGLDPNKKDLGRQIKYSQSADGGGTWTKWKNISIVSGYDGEDYWQEHPQVTTDNNYVYIVWEGKDAKNDQQQIKFSKSSDGGATFDEWKNLQPTPQNTQSRPSTLIDKNGWLHLFMYSSQSMNDDVQQIWHSLSKDNGDTWSTWENVSRSKFDARHVSAVFDGSNIMAVWRQQAKEGGPSQLFYSIYSGSSWSKPKTVGVSVNYQLFPILGLSGEGVFITWVETLKDSDFPKDDPDGGLGYVSHYHKSEQKFSKPLSLSPKQDILYPHITTGNLDAVYLVYEKEFDDDYGIFLDILTVK